MYRLEQVACNLFLLLIVLLLLRWNCQLTKTDSSNSCMNAFILARKQLLSNSGLKTQGNESLVYKGNLLAVSYSSMYFYNPCLLWSISLFNVTIPFVRDTHSGCLNSQNKSDYNLHWHRLCENHFMFISISFLPGFMYT